VAERPFELVRHPLVARLLEVTAVRAVTPRMVRVTLGGPELEGFVSLAPEDHVKLFFPEPGETLPVMPHFGRPDQGQGMLWPGDARPVARDYTPIHHDPRARTVAIDFFLHGRGPAAVWAAAARPGQRLGLAGPRGSYVYRGTADWQLFVGDETALPEMARRLEEMPAGSRAFAVLLVEDRHEEQPLPTLAALQVQWLHRERGQAGERGAASGDDLGARLVESVRRLALPARGGFAWLAGEAMQVRAVYRHLVHEVGMDRTAVRASGHWRRGVANHDHHQPVEAL
jgi:NADPH-dependent ferric siderophore reductase